MNWKKCIDDVVIEEIDDVQDYYLMSLLKETYGQQKDSPQTTKDKTHTKSLVGKSKQMLQTQKDSAPLNLLGQKYNNQSISVLLQNKQPGSS